MTDYSELKRLAEMMKAHEEKGAAISATDFQAFHSRAMNPAVILAILAELEALRERVYRTESARITLEMVRKGLQHDT